MIPVLLNKDESKIQAYRWSFLNFHDFGENSFYTQIETFIDDAVKLLMWF